MLPTTNYLVIPISHDDLKLPVADAVKTALEKIRQDEEGQTMITF
jgi:hypothetical protein